MLKTVFLLGILFIAHSFASQCRDENGKTVKWFVALREPNSRRYQYFDESWSTFRTLNDETFLKNIFQGISTSTDQVLLWNDEPAAVDGYELLLSNIQSTSTAHDKGVLYRNRKDSTGFYLLHSVPKFPEVHSSVLNPATPISSNYGQSMICISLSSDSSFSTIWNHIKAQNSVIYLNSFAYPLPPNPTSLTVDSYIEGSTFRLVTKTPINMNPPFEGMLAPFYQSGFLVESWGRPYSPNTYSPFKVINNQQVNFPSKSYSDTNDHSKYTVSLSIKGLLCVGGMNHMDSQASRGGSFVCFKNYQLYDQLWNVILTPPAGLRSKRLLSSKKSRGEQIYR